jgi:hypothetical protein
MALKSKRGFGERPKRNAPLMELGVVLLVLVLPLAWFADSARREAKAQAAAYENYTSHLKALDERLADPKLTLRDKGQLTKERERWAQGAGAAVVGKYESARRNGYWLAGGALVAGVAGAVALSQSRARKKPR